MVYVAEQQAGIGAVDNQTNVVADPDRPEVSITGLINPMKLQSGLRRIDLQIKGGGLYGLLLVASQFGQAIDERIGDAEFQVIGPQALRDS